MEKCLCHLLGQMGCHVLPCNTRVRCLYHASFKPIPTSLSSALAHDQYSLPISAPQSWTVLGIQLLSEGLRCSWHHASNFHSIILVRRLRRSWHGALSYLSNYFQIVLAGHSYRNPLVTLLFTGRPHYLAKCETRQPLFCSPQKPKLASALRDRRSTFVL